jgi:type VI secretion system secreted protein Hcp
MVCRMAESIHLFLKANGADIQGESTQLSVGRENSIECVEFKDAVRTAREHGSRAAVGRRVHEPIEIIKRIDKSTPLLAKALCNNEKIEGEFKFYRPNPAGDGTTEQFFTVKIEGGRIDSIERHSPNAFDPAESKNPPLEKIRFVYAKITWIFIPTGAEHVDEWSNGN